MTEELTRHFLKGTGLITIFLAMLAATAIVITYLSRWFLLRERISIPSGASWFEIVSRSFNELARRKTLAVIVVGFTALAVRAVVLPITKVPAPNAHDEFSYLLAGDTFAHGRLTNPTPVVWMPFESIHINVRPTYMSMYPPGQGFVLAVGQLLGNPWIGVWLMSGLGCAITCWALQAWLPPRWALLGGVLAILQFVVLSYWTSSYYCTWLPAAGGGLVLGALPRLRRRPRVRDAVLLAVGVSVLAMTRPYESLVFSLPVAAMLFSWILRPAGRSLGITISRVFVPISLVLLLTGAFLADYNLRVSGNPLLMPYKLNQQAYAVVPLFVWQHLTPASTYRNVEMRNYYLGWEVSEYHNTVTSCIAKMTWIKFQRYWWFYFGPVLSLALLAVPKVLFDRRIRFLLIVIAVTMIGAELEVWSHPHYVAPLTCALLAVILQCMRHMQFWRWHGKEIGRWLVWAMVLACFAFDAAWLSAMAVHINYSRMYMAGNQARATVQRQLERVPGNHLVLVRYTTSHLVFREWVYNRADIAHARIIWARDLGPECDRQLVREYGGRRVWVVEPDADPVQLEPYTPSSLPVSSKSVCSAEGG